MAVSDLGKVLEIFVRQNGKSIDFVGGEPALHPNFLQMVKMCVDTGIEIWIYTNLREFARNQQLAPQLLSIGGDVTVVGKLNVPNPDDPRQKKIQAKMICAPEQAVDEMWQGLKNLLLVGFPEGKIGIENLVRTTNIDFAPDVYETGIKMGFFVDLEIPTCPFTAGIKSFKNWLKLFPDKKQILDCIKKIQEIDRKYKRPVCEKPMMPHLTGRNEAGIGIGCTGFKQGALLTEVDGRVGMCTSGIPLMNNGNQLNILKNPLEEIFSHPNLIARRESCVQINIKEGHCKNCSHWNNCMAGCSALRETLGIVSGSYPLCYLHEWPSKDELIQMYENR
ncbi:hypothetical protein COT27_00535, partial [Candidatus Kuenenbacteria bacterium CG08_land_8_20_14_0_20_37_23]